MNRDAYREYVGEETEALAEKTEILSEETNIMSEETQMADVKAGSLPQRAKYHARIDRFLTNGIMIVGVLLIGVLLIAFLV
ncbi:MAG: hypothetical protein Q4B80_04980 [Aerococcaceae bacterium]|nr:hypothetical protein [Aerococcaceae bacterium]